MDELKEWPNVATDFLKQVLEARGVGPQLRILRDFRKLATKRHALRDITEKLSHGLFELKTSHAGMEYRSIYVHHHPHIVVLVCFEKKKQKTPKHFIDLARARHVQLLKEEVEVGHVTLH